MKKISKIIFATASVALLASCNSDMKTITDEKATTLASEIAARQKTESIPSKFIISAVEKEIEDSKKESGTKKTTGTGEAETIFDSENLKRKITVKESSDTTSSNEESIVFYDESKNILYTLKNKNGKKTRQEETMAKSEAITNFNKFITEKKIAGTTYEEIIKYNSYFAEFAATLTKHQTYKKAVEGQNDQYYNYSFGSNNEKSFQEKLDSKIKIEIPSVSVTYAYTKSDLRINNDLVEYVYSNAKTESKTTDGLFYENHETTKEIKYSYNKADITIPDINNYEKVD